MTTSERVGRYQLLEPIGMGPCGTVSRAKVFGVAGFERQFAIKRFHPEVTITTALASALSSAARAYGSLEHPRIARMSEFGIAQGVTFTAVELVTGLDAARLVAETKLSGDNLAAGGALALVSQAARAVGYAHGRGLTHLGLSPTNVIVTSDGDIKITDFGILAAGLPQRPVDVARLQQRIQYLAPEQVANEATSAATDVFALGVIAYELVTGQRTFKGDSPQQIASAIMNGPPPEPPLPRPIVRVLHRCLARSPFERFPDARALADALDAALRVAPVPGTRKDVGAQVKATMDRLAEMSANEMSGMVAFNVGTGPIPRIAPHEIQSLGRMDPPDAVMTPDPATHEFVRPDVPVPGPAPLVGPAATIPAPPPLPPLAPPGSTLLGMATMKSPPQIPPIKPRAVSQPVPTIPKMGGRDFKLATQPGLGAPPPLPAQPAPPPPPPSPILKHNPVGRIEIDPQSAFDPSAGMTIEELFDDDVSTSSAADAFDGDEGVRTQTQLPRAPSAPPLPPVVARTISRPVPIRAMSETPTSEMSPAFVDKLREEASDPDGGSLEVQMEVVAAPEDSDVRPLPLPAPLPSSPSIDLPAATQPSMSPPPVRVQTAPIAREIPSLVPSATATQPITPARSRLPLVALLVVGGAALAVGAWQLLASSKDEPVVAVVHDAAPFAVIPDATKVAVVASDASLPAVVVDAVVVDAAVAVATVDAGTPVASTSDQLVVTSTPAGARVYLDGSDVGVTPVKLDASTDRHTIALLLAGHELYIAEVDGKGAFAIALKEVTPNGGIGAGVKVINCKAKERYYVFADGKPTGMMCPTERIKTGMGQHTIEVYDAVTETKQKWDVDLKDDRLSHRIRIE